MFVQRTGVIWFCIFVILNSHFHFYLLWVSHIVSAKVCIVFCKPWRSLPNIGHWPLLSIKFYLRSCLRLLPIVDSISFSRSLFQKGKGQYICIMPYCRQPTSKALRYGNALSRDHTVLPAHPRVYLRTEWTVPAFAFPAEAGTHLPTPKRWKAGLVWATRAVYSMYFLISLFLFVH